MTIEWKALQSMIGGYPAVDPLEVRNLAIFVNLNLIGGECPFFRDLGRVQQLNFRESYGRPWESTFGQSRQSWVPPLLLDEEIPLNGLRHVIHSRDVGNENAELDDGRHTVRIRSFTDLHGR